MNHWDAFTVPKQPSKLESLLTVADLNERLVEGLNLHGMYP